MVERVRAVVAPVARRHEVDGGLGLRPGRVAVVVAPHAHQPATLVDHRGEVGVHLWSGGPDQHRLAPGRGRAGATSGGPGHVRRVPVAEPRARTAAEQLGLHAAPVCQAAVAARADGPRLWDVVAHEGHPLRRRPARHHGLVRPHLDGGGAVIMPRPRYMFFYREPTM